MARREYNVVTDFGVTPLAPDAAVGSTNHTSLIQNAIIQTQIGGAQNSNPDVGGSLLFPSGVYYVNANLFNAVLQSTTDINRSRVTLRGDALNATIIRVLPSVAAGARIFSTQGKQGWSNPGNPAGTENANKQADYFTLRDMTLDGNNQPITWLYFNSTSFTRLERLEVINTPSTVLHGSQWWDSVIHDVTFRNCGGGATAGDLPAVLLETRNTFAYRRNFSSCNNLKFSACRWLDLKNIGLWLKDYSRVNYLIDCLFTSATDAGDFAQIKVNVNYILSILGTRFFQGYQNIGARDCAGLLIGNSSFERSKHSAINLYYNPTTYAERTMYSTFVGNSFCDETRAATSGMNRSGGPNPNYNIEGFDPSPTSFPTYNQAWSIG